MSDDPLRRIHLPAAYEPIYLPSCDSALAAAAQLAQDGAPEGRLLWAGAQIDARGRRGQAWLSPPGGLYCAVVLRPALPPARLGEFVPVATIALGTAIAEQVSAMTDLRYRWPNVIDVNGARVASIGIQTGADWLVLSCAANVAEPPAGDFDCACLCIEGGNPDLDAGALLEAYARHLLAGLTRWDEEGVAPAARHLASRAAQPGEPITLRRIDGSAVCGEFKAINPDGSLRLQGPDGDLTIGLNAYLGLPDR